MFPLYWDKNFKETVTLTSFDSEKGAGDSSEEPKNHATPLSVLDSPGYPVETTDNNRFLCSSQLQKTNPMVKISYPIAVQRLIYINNHRSHDGPVQGSRGQALLEQ
jgi:hypothetical protein